MKPIKIIRKNEESIDKALAKVNDQARAHTYGSMWDLTRLVKNAERQLSDYGIPKKIWKGVSIRSTSGDKVPNAYDRKGHTRIATHVIIDRKATGWFLVNVQKTTVWQEGGGTGLHLTAEQDETAVKNLRSKYVAPAC